MLAATWFVAYSAVLPLTQAAWGLSAREAGIVQGAFHLGYLVSLFLVGFIAGEGQYWAVLSAAATMAALPVILCGWFAQNKLVRGLSFGAIK